MLMAAPVQNNNGSLLASGIGALGSVGSSLLSGIFNYASMAKQNEYAKDLMRYQWENFASPRAQAQAMAAAGINPAVAFGQGGSGFTSTPSPTMPSSSPPSMAGMMDIAGFVKAMAEAKKAGLESVGQQLENELAKQSFNERLKSFALQNNLSQEQINNLQQEWNKTTAEINALSTDRELKQLELDKYPELVSSILRQYKDRHNLDHQQFEALKEQLPVILNKLKAEEKILNVDADIAGSYKETMANLGIVGQAIQILTKLVGIFK